MKVLLTHQDLMDMLKEKLGLETKDFTIKCETLLTPNGSWPVGKQYLVVTTDEAE